MENNSKANEQKVDVAQRYALLRKNTGSLFLVRNQRLMNCPFSDPIVTQEFVQSKLTLGGGDDEKMVTKIDNRKCGDWCPHFHIKENSGTVSVVMGCSAKDMKFPIDMLAAEEKKEGTQLTPVK